jgi:hypothetical protein
MPLVLEHSPMDIDSDDYDELRPAPMMHPMLDRKEVGITEEDKPWLPL